MPNIASVLKDEIRRLARKEAKAFANASKRVVAKYRKDIAILKRQVREQQKKLSSIVSASVETLPAEEDPLADVRFSARSVAAQRKRLGLSAADYGRLVGVSGLTIYNWEHGKARPRMAQLAALVAMRGIGKREAIMKLEAIAPPKRKPRRAKR